jgi:hypothetical protein
MGGDGPTPSIVTRAARVDREGLREKWRDVENGAHPGAKDRRSTDIDPGHGS